MGNIPPQRNRKDLICFSPYLYRARNLFERFFNKIKQCRRVATRYDKLAATYLWSSNLHQSEFGCALMSPRPSPPSRSSVFVRWVKSAVLTVRRSLPVFPTSGRSRFPSACFKGANNGSRDPGQRTCISSMMITSHATS